MGIALTQIIPEDRASGAQVIDGSLRFDGSQRLERTFANNSGTTWTWSAWIKITDFGTGDFQIFGTVSPLQFHHIRSNNFGWTQSTVTQNESNLRRDPSAWYHRLDVSNGTNIRAFINGELAVTWTQASVGTNTNVEHFLGGESSRTSEFFKGYLSEVYFVDGQALTATDFGFTDPLTNTWRPKKYEGTFGDNGFWLPFDGNTPIGQDKSGQGNDWTPINFGSNSIEKATGALPILNTVNGGKIATAGVRTDTAIGAAATCILALPLNDGTAKFDVSHLVDSKGTERTISNAGASVTLSDYNFYGASYTFDGSNSRMSHTVADNGPFFLRDDYTVEGWAKLASGQTDDRYMFALNQNVSANSEQSWMLRINSSKWQGVIINGGTQFSTTAAEDYIPNKWQHIAWVREGDQERLYVDGTLVDLSSDTERPNLNSGSDLFIGSLRGANNNINGQFQDLRIYTGVAKYTGSTVGTQYFTPASTNPDIVPDTPSGTAYSSKLTEVTEGGVDLDGTGDFLSIENHADLRFGSDDFCVEAFVYYTETSGNGTIAGLWNSGDNRRSWLLQVESDNRRLRGFYSTDGSSSTAINGTTGHMTRNAWHHVAYTRSGNDLRIFLDGQIVGSASESGSFFNNTTDDIGVGSAQGGAASDEKTGFISNLRIVKGSAVYTAAFTPPDAPLTNISNTKLLCAQDLTTFVNGAQPILNTNATGITTATGTRRDIFSSNISLAIPMNGSDGGTTFTDVHNTIKGSGSAKSITREGPLTSTDQSYYYGSSGEFDGSNDRLEIANDSDFDFGTGAYTIEMWIRTSANAGFLYYAANDNTGMRLCVGNNGEDNGNNTGRIEFNEQVSNADRFDQGSTQVNDNEWHHIAVCRGASGDNTRLYVDGRLDATGTSNRNFNSNNTLHIGSRESGGSAFAGFIQDLRVYKGISKYTGSGFIVKARHVEPSAEVIPTGNITANGQASASNFNPFNTDINTVRGQETGYPTLNPLFQQSNVTLSNGNLGYAGETTSAKVATTVGLSTAQGGKWYWEITQNSTRRPAAGVMNIVGTANSFGAGTDIGENAHEWGLRFSNSSTAGAGTALQKSHNSTTTDLGTFAIEQGGTAQFAMDLDNTSIWFGANGSWMGGDPVANANASFTNLTGTLVPFVQRQTGISSCSINFGQKPFKYAPPEGFKPINFSNLPRPSEPALTPNKYVGIVTYTGNGSSKSISGLGFEPGFVWIKRYDGTAQHTLTDVNRGTNKQIFSNRTQQEQTSSIFITSFDPDGFSVGASDTGTGNVNVNENDFVAWCWKANGPRVTNNDGNTTSRISALPEAGFSIIDYDGAGNGTTIGHGLGKKPEFILFKALGEPDSTAQNWNVYHHSITAENVLFLNLANQQSDDAGFMADTEPTDSIIHLGSSFSVSHTGSDYIAYAWTSIEGFSKFGSYAANNNADGPFIELGFKPQFLIIKSATSVTNWHIYDTARDPTNRENKFVIHPNSDAAQKDDADERLDILSNGFKLRSVDNDNVGNNTYIYAAWAEAPQLNLYGGQPNAR